MSRKELREEHIKLWTWLSKNPDKEKSQYFILMYPHATVPINECFCCELSEKNPMKIGYSVMTCENCPITWVSNQKEIVNKLKIYYFQDVPCWTIGSAYKNWCLLHNKKIRAKVARKIAGMWPEDGK